MIDKKAKTYIRQGVLLAVGLCMVGLIIMQVWRLDALLAPLVVSTVFSIVFEVVDALVWRKVAKSSPESLPTFFMTVSSVRMFAALAVMFVYYFTAEGEMSTFLIVFAVFYVTQMIHHALFFTRISNKM